MVRPGKFSPKIIHKGLALVLVPILVESIFFWQLYGLVVSAEQLAQAERRQSAIVERMNFVMTLFANATGSMFSYLITGKQSYSMQGKAYLDGVRSEFDAMDLLMKDDPSLRSVLTEFRAMSEDEFRKLAAFTPPEPGTNYSTALSSITELKPYLKQANAKSRKVMKIIVDQRTHLEEVRQEEVASREKVKALVFAGILLNLLLALALVLIFIKDITGRLGVLVENARLLPTGQPLMGHVRGSDELNYLDNALHAAAHQLRQAAEHRQSLMEMVAHDLRSPLMSSQVSLEILSADQIARVLPQQAVRQVDSVKRNISRLVNLTNDLLTLDKLEAGKLDLELAEVDIKTLVDESFSSVSGLAKQKQIELVNDCHEQKATLDKDRITQVLVNYLSNAIKFSPQNTVVNVFSGQSYGQLLISVQDQGPGMSAAEQAKLFQKFHQNKNENRSQGFGLGLAICKLIVESHGGRVGVESESGQNTGSCFWFTIPD